MQRYFKGVLYFLCMLFISSMNDAIQRFLVAEMHGISILFFRYFFATFFIFFYILFKNKSIATTKINFILHIIRSLCLFLGQAIWIYFLNDNSIPLLHFTLIAYFIPLISLIFGYFFLQEKIFWERWVSIIAATIVMAFLVPFFSSPRIVMGFWASPASISYILLIIAATLFAITDIINKYIINTESMYNMLFYSSLLVTIMCLPAMFSFGFEFSNTKGILISMILGLNANFLFFALLKAFSYVDISVLAYYRFFEFIFTGLMGFLFFYEVPDDTFYLSLLFIVPLTMFFEHSERNNHSERNDSSSRNNKGIL